MSDLMTTAIEAARIGGAVLMSRRGSRPTGIDEKGQHDYVTDVDRASQRAVIDFLRRARPDDAILAEEQESHPGTSGYQWILDPLDGTTNYIHDYPFFAVSLGVWASDEGIAGVVFDPMREELFQAERGAGAWLNGKRLRVSNALALAGSLLVTGFPFRNLERIDAYVRSFHDLMPRCAGIRRDGSAALDLCYVACGRVDGFWEMALSPWDLAAGVVIVREAGGRVSDYLGGTEFMRSGNIVAAAPGVHADLLAVLQRHHAPGTE